jgi:uncharacterized protein
MRVPGSQERSMSTTFAQETAISLPMTYTASPPLKPKPFGFWSTTGWLLLAIFGSLVASAVVTGIGLAIAIIAKFGSIESLFENQTAAFARQNAFIIVYGIGALIYVFAVLFVALGARLARWRFVDYVALAWPERRHIVLAIAATLALMGIDVALDYVFKFGAQDHAKMVLEYVAAKGASALPLMWLLIVVFAPIVEEIVFRGFLFRGWAASWLRVPGTVVLTSLIFGALHFQYSIAGVVYCILLGFLFAWLRLRSGTIVAPILAHMLNNSITMAVLAIEISLAS